MLKFERYYNGRSEKLLSDIIADSITGMVIENCLADKECEHFKKIIIALKTSFFHDLNNGNGYSLPAMFGQLHKTQPIDLVAEYFKQIEGFCRAVNHAAGIDVAQWLQSSLEKYFTPYNCLPLPGFLPYSFRVVFPAKGGLFVHKDGQLLPYIHDEVSEKIVQYILPETMMSWYFTLQDPIEGGELWIADNLYDDCVKDGQFAMLKPEGKRIELDEMEHIKVKTPAGSLLMFKGGCYWHKVIPPEKDFGDRITLGGFMALSPDRTTVYYWS